VSLSSLAYLAGCGEAYNLGADEPAVEEEESTCNVGVSSSGSIFALNQADVDALSGCRELPGTLYVRVPEEESDTFSLAALADLEVVDGLLSIAGPLDSLAGLESLERVGSLELRNLRVSDLTSLANLQSVQRAPSDDRSRGLIRIQDCDELVDLTGLEALTRWSSISLANLDNLTTLDGLHTPPLVERAEISEAPRLVDVSALATMEDVGTLWLTRTAIPNLAGFSIHTVESVGLYENDALTDLAGLSRLQKLYNLWIEGNDALLRVELPALDDFAAISIIGNAVLEAVPHYESSSGNWPQPSGVFGDQEYVRPSRALFEVGDNPQVASIVLPTDFTDIEQVAIYGNAGLTTLEMGHLVRSNNIWIQNNASLQSVAAASLAQVDALSILNNPALSVAPFANVQTFQREVNGNLDELAP
jgi:hypothetical protein